MTLALPSKVRGCPGNRVADGLERNETELELQVIV
jgi:hypothetical protein